MGQNESRIQLSLAQLAPGTVLIEKGCAGSCCHRCFRWSGQALEMFVGDEWQPCEPEALRGKLQDAFAIISPVAAVTPVPSKFFYYCAESTGAN